MSICGNGSFHTPDMGWLYLRVQKNGGILTLHLYEWQLQGKLQTESLQLKTDEQYLYSENKVARAVVT